MRLFLWLFILMFGAKIVTFSICSIPRQRYKYVSVFMQSSTSLQILHGFHFSQMLFHLLSLRKLRQIPSGRMFWLQQRPRMRPVRLLLQSSQRPGQPLYVDSRRRTILWDAIYGQHFIFTKSRSCANLWKVTINAGGQKWHQWNFHCYQVIILI